MRDYIDVWPAGWSEITHLFNTSIFTDRFLVAEDVSSGFGFLTADGLYFRELDLVYRVVKDGEVQEKIILASQREIITQRLSTDSEGNMYAVWIEKSSDGYSLNYLELNSARANLEPIILLATDHTIRDLAVFQEGAVTHIVWSEWEEHLQIKYGRVENGVLAAVEAVTENTNLSVRPSVTVDKQGHPCVVWMESDPHEAVRIFFSKKTGGTWSQPLAVGPGSVYDIEQGGSIVLLPTENGLIMAWAALARNSNRLFVHLSEVGHDLSVTGPIVLAAGSRPRLLQDDSGLQLVWQGEDQFGSRIYHAHLRNGGLERVTNLTIGRKAGFRPEVMGVEGYVHVFWLQADPERGFNVHMINNRFPKAISWWQKAGIDEKAPAYHLVYLFVSNSMLSFAYLFGSAGVILVGWAISSFLFSFTAYRKQNLFYKITLSALILLVVRSLPIPSVVPAFFGLLHYGLSVVLAILGTYFILRGIQQKGIFLSMAVVLLWTFLFLFFSLIPQNILS